MVIPTILPQHPETATTAPKHLGQAVLQRHPNMVQEPQPGSPRECLCLPGWPAPLAPSVLFSFLTRQDILLKDSNAFLDLVPYSVSLWPREGPVHGAGCGSVWVQ